MLDERKAYRQLPIRHTLTIADALINNILVCLFHMVASAFMTVRMNTALIVLRRQARSLLGPSMSGWELSVMRRSSNCRRLLSSEE